MPRVAILIPASPNAAFLSQVAAFRVALGNLRWTRWHPTIYLYLGGPCDFDLFAKWRRHLPDVEIIWSSPARFEQKDNWAQSDAVFELAPRDADVILTMDADTLPVRNFEDVLDRVIATDCVAGLIAHYPFPLFPGTRHRENWQRAAAGIVDVPLDFQFSYSLMDPAPDDPERQAPFYLNFGVVFFSANRFDGIAKRYLSIRPTITDRMHDPGFSGQVALTLAITAERCNVWSLGMRYNFPNDPIAERMYPEEKMHAVIYHYLRTTHFDRHLIFSSAERYHAFLDLKLTGSNHDFQHAVRALLGSQYPFD
jgi:hypothetical protein